MVTREANGRHFDYCVKFSRAFSICRAHSYVSQAAPWMPSPYNAEYDNDVSLILFHGQSSSPTPRQPRAQIVLVQSTSMDYET